MLAAYLVWHLRQAWAPLTFTDENRPEAVDPVAPAQRSKDADAKAATKTTTDDQPARSFTTLLDHLATLTRNHLRVAGHDQSGFDLLAIPTPTQHHKPAVHSPTATTLPRPWAHTAVLRPPALRDGPSARRGRNSARRATTLNTSRRIAPLLPRMTNQ